ncbi:hypothetical protein ABWW58_02665 [Sporolactobacillus sp. STCC-11]|uniref:hypothetical protein n=1 Tax=Sporolactobacillus caesalpiniae TaxID=3230362 RepID=UPI003397E7C0
MAKRNAIIETILLLLTTCFLMKRRRVLLELVTLILGHLIMFRRLKENPPDQSP